MASYNDKVRDEGNYGTRNSQEGEQKNQGKFRNNSLALSQRYYLGSCTLIKDDVHL